MKRVKILKRSIFSIIVSLLLVLIFGCQGAIPIVQGPSDDSGDKDYEEKIYKEDEEETYNENYEYVYTPAFDVKNIQCTKGVTLYCGDNLDGYKVNGLKVDFLEGSLTDKLQYGTVMVNDEVFGENFYNGGILKSAYYNNYSADYEYDKSGKLVSITDNVGSGNTYKYYYDFDGNLKLIMKKNNFNGVYEVCKAYIYGFEQYDIDYNKGENYYSEYTDIRKEYFYKYCSKDMLYQLYYAGKKELANGTQYVAEIDFENKSGSIFIYDKNGKITDNIYGDLIKGSQIINGGLRADDNVLFFINKRIYVVKEDEAVYEYNYNYNGNRYLTKKINGKYSYTYEYINNYMVSETCVGPENFTYTISYIFDAEFNRIGFYYDNEIFFYNVNILGNVDSIINAKGETVVKYNIDLFGNINYYIKEKDIFDIYNITPKISGPKKDDIGLYNSFIYKINQNFMYDRQAKKYHINENVIFDVETCAFTKSVKNDSEWVNFFNDPVNTYIAKMRQKQTSLDTVVREKVQSLIAETLYIQDISSYINTMVWGLSDYSRIAESEAYENEETLTFEEFSEAFLSSNPNFYDEHDIEFLLASFPNYRTLYNMYGGDSVQFTIMMMYQQYLIDQETSTCNLSYREDFDILADATGKSAGRADIFTSTLGDMGKIWGSQIYLVAKDTKYDILNAEIRRQNLTALSFVYDYNAKEYIMPYTGEFVFCGHFIYCNRYITYDTNSYGIVTFNIYENYKENFNYYFGNLYSYDTEKYIGVVEPIRYKGTAFTLAEIAARAAETTYESLIQADYSFQGGITTTAYNYYYYNAEAVEELKRNKDKSSTVFGYNSEELKAKMDTGYYLSNENGQTVFKEQKTGDEIDIGEMLTKIAIGTAVIVVSATIIAATAGGAAPLACFFVTAATLTAVSLAGGAIAAGIDWALGGDPQKVAKSFANGFLFTAVLSSAVSITTGMGAACFEENTPLETRNGQVAIQNIKPFDFVLSYNHQTQVTEYKRVLKTYAKEAKQTVTIVAGDEKITATLEHPFFANGAYVAAKDLKAGDKLKNSENQYVRVKSVKINNLKNSITVYNLEVEDNQNYFAGNVLVHNICSMAKPLIPAGASGMPGGYGIKEVTLILGKITLGAISAGTLLSFNFRRVGDPIDYGRGYIPVGDLFISRFWVYTADHFGSVYDKTGMKKVYRMAYIDQDNILQVIGRWIVPRTNPYDIYIPRVGVWGYALDANQALTILWLGGIYNRTVAPHISDARFTDDGTIWGVEDFDQILLANYNDPMVQKVFKLFAHNIPTAKAVGVYAYDPHDAMYLAMRAGLAPSVVGPTWYDFHDSWLAGGPMVESYFISGYNTAGHFHFVDPTKSIYLWYMDPYYTAFYANKNGLQYRRNNPWTKHAFE